MDKMSNSQKEDFKDTNVERNNNPFDVLGKKRYLTSYNPKIKTQKIPWTVAPRAEVFVCCCLFVCFFPTKSFGWLATSRLCFVSGHANDFVSVMV